MLKWDLFESCIEIETNATGGWYAQAQDWDCDCAQCQHFLALAREKKLPDPVLNCLNSLGIPPEKATYVCAVCPRGEDFLYQFSYRIAGRILSGDPHTVAAQSWGGGRCWQEDYPYGAPGFPEPHFDLEFWVTLPGDKREYSGETI